MWCWHRIRESETGLCPACRTPYGEDPHQFTALDVEEVLKANKEALAVAKRERYQLQQSQLHTTINFASPVTSNSNAHSASSSNAAALGGASSSMQHSAAASASAVSETASNASGDFDHFSTTTMEIPKDRSQLANMRVIRRNLIYAVGLPVAVASEDTLRRPDYFGQYGKIAKIVLNRAQIVPGEGGDPRRASASAYVTFQHKEDALACILALDGFYLENRNVRASYGTSKYCSAFIKSVRCNNPECTYLHEMGATEDTFTKQEIQAGYVTSGRDVLARQQQIMAEQLLQQQLSAAGKTHLPPRKRIGGGGPSGTGKASTNPVFPPPEFDEPARYALATSSTTLGLSRAVTTTATTASSSSQPNALNAKVVRSISTGTSSSGLSPILSSSNFTKQAQPSSAGASATTVTTSTTAAAVVAGNHTLMKESSELQQPHLTLTALTPLKRTAIKTLNVVKPPSAEENMPAIRNGKKQNGARGALASGAAKTTTGIQKPARAENIVGLIGGDLIGPPLSAISSSSTIGANRFTDSSLGKLGGMQIPVSSSLTPNRSSAASLLGGEIFNGPLIGQSNNSNTVVVGSSLLNSPTFGTSSENYLSRGSGSLLWNGDAGPGPNGNGVIGSHISAKNSGSSSALASILGINLPTGSGSLQESTSFWSSTTHIPDVQPASTNRQFCSTNGSLIHQPSQHRQQTYSGTTVTRSSGLLQPSHNDSSLVGGVPIGNGSSNFSGVGLIGAGSEGNQNDIALLQSLLPGVHITTDNNPINFSGAGWASSPTISQNTRPVASNRTIFPSGGWVGGSNSRLQASTVGSPVGAIGQNHGQQKQNQGPGIW